VHRFHTGMLARSTDWPRDPRIRRRGTRWR
jgi:hypothetical protein